VDVRRDRGVRAGGRGVGHVAAADHGVTWTSR
jgi:hypothetical protein